MPPRTAGEEASRPRAQAGQWALEDLVDLEILVREDAENTRTHAEALRERDARIAASYPGGAVSRGAERSGPVRHWLEVRRRDRFPGIPSPGAELISLLGWVWAGLFLLGLGVARGAVWSFFRGAELGGFHPEPINVPWYALVCIGLPFLFSVYGIWLMVGRGSLPTLPAAPAFLRGVLLAVLKPLLKRVAHETTEQLGAEKRLNAQSLLGVLRQRLDSRKGALSAALIHFVQAFGVAFTVGVLVFSWIDCRFYSRVFGWQTTAGGASAETVHRLVRAAAVPWSWLHGEGAGYPSLAQVEQTRFIRLRDPADFPPEAAAAWANFLIWAALVYGLLPRLALERYSAWQARRALEREGFTDLRFDDLWERLSVAGAAMQHGHDDAPQDGGLSAMARPEAPQIAPTVAYRLILPADVEARGCLPAIEQWMREQKGWETARPAPMRAGLEEKQRILAALKAEAGREHVLLLRESFMAAAQQDLTFLQNLREAIGPEAKILVGLLGKPDSTPLGEPPTAIDEEVWQKKVATVGDRNLGVISFLPPR